MELKLVSVVVPAFNEHRFISRCLQSLAQQDYTGQFEIIVVDNNSTDNTAAVAKSFGAKVIYEGRRGIARARQCGFMAARGDIIASTDADTIVPTNWLSQINQIFTQNPQAVAVGGFYLLYDGPVNARWLIKLALGLMPFIIKFAPWLWNLAGCNFAVRRGIFLALNGFNLNVEVGEDMDFCRRLRRVGEIIFEPRLLVQTSGRSYLKDPTCLSLVLNYFSILVLNKPLLPWGPLAKRDKE